MQYIEKNLEAFSIPVILTILALFLSPSHRLYAQEEMPPLPSSAPVSGSTDLAGPTGAAAGVPPQSAVLGASGSIPEKDSFNPDEYDSLIFTYWEHVAIEDARKSRGVRRAPTDSELQRALDTVERDPMKKPPPEEREIALGGIVFHRTGDWTIWLNKKRVTPDAIPEEIIDLRVFNEYIEMKWFDEYTNQIFPVRLRPHQRFNMDARMFLPG